MKPCIIAVGYNRPECLERLLKSINNAVYDVDDVTLIISLDKAEDDRGCFKLANSFKWLHGSKIVRTFPKRQGLRNHILECGKLTNEYGSVIILEDDLLVSPLFYRYAMNALEFYKDDELVNGISLYSHSWNGYANRFFEPFLDGKDTFLGQFSITWGECWTKKWFDNFYSWYSNHLQLDPHNPNLPDSVNRWPETSWGKYFITFLVDKNLFYIIPSVSLSTNCSAPGQHNVIDDSSHQVRLMDDREYRYSFFHAKDLYRYDIFFENIDIIDLCFSEFKSEGVLIDLFGIKKNNGCRYLLTTQRLKYKVIKSYGLSMRPIWTNIIHNYPGNCIFLYDLTNKGKKPKKNKYSVLKYELRGFNIFDIWSFYWPLLKESLKRRIKRILRKRKRR